MTVTIAERTYSVTETGISYKPYILRDGTMSLTTSRCSQRGVIWAFNGATYVGSFRESDIR